MTLGFPAAFHTSRTRPINLMLARQAGESDTGDSHSTRILPCPTLPNASERSASSSSAGSASGLFLSTTRQNGTPDVSTWTYLSASATASGMAEYRSCQKQTAAQIDFFRAEPDTTDPAALRTAAACELAESAFVGGELPEAHIGGFLENFVAGRLGAAEELVGAAGAAVPQDRHVFNRVLVERAPAALGIGRPDYATGDHARKRRRVTARVPLTGFWEAVPQFIARRPTPSATGEVPVGYGLP